MPWDPPNCPVCTPAVVVWDAACKATPPVPFGSQEACPPAPQSCPAHSSPRAIAVVRQPVSFFLATSEAEHVVHVRARVWAARGGGGGACMWRVSVAWCSRPGGEGGEPNAETTGES